MEVVVPCPTLVADIYHRNLLKFHNSNSNRTRPLPPILLLLLVKEACQTKLDELVLQIHLLLLVHPYLVQQVLSNPVCQP